MLISNAQSSVLYKDQKHHSLIKEHSRRLPFSMNVVSKSSKNKISSILGEIDKSFTSKNKDASNSAEIELYESIE